MYCGYGTCMYKCQQKNQYVLITGFRVSIEKARGTPRGTDRDKYLEKGWRIENYAPRRRGGGWRDK